MSIFVPQNPGIGGLNELTEAEEITVQTIAALGTPGYFLRTNLAGTAVEWAAVAGGGGSGDVVGPATNSDSYIPQWDGVNTKTLKNGIPTSTFASALGADDNYVTDAEKTSIGTIPNKVTGPASSTDNAVARFDSTTGKLLENSTVLLEDDGSFENVNSVRFDLSYTGTPVAGEMYWDDTEKTVILKSGFNNNSVELNRGTDIRVYNNSGSTIGDGIAVYMNGANGTTPTMALAQANDYTKSIKTIGITTMSIANNAYGLVTVLGNIHDLNTSSYTDGDIIYLSSSVSGGITSTNPTGLNYTIELGRVVYAHATNGVIFVNPRMLRAIESDEFKVVDSTDKTKQAAFNVSGIGAGTRRVFTLPNADTTLIGTTTTDTLTNKSISLGTNTVTSTFAQLNTAVTDAEIARTDAANTFTGTQTISQIDLGNTDTSITRSAAGVMAVEGVVIPSISSTNTLTNKRVTKRTGTTTSSATPTINTDSYDEYYITAQTVDITSFTTNLTGTPIKGDHLFISIIGTAARAITWGASFGNGPVALPTTTITTTELSVFLKYDGSIWRCYATGSRV